MKSLKYFVMLLIIGSLNAMDGVDNSGLAKKNHYDDAMNLTPDCAPPDNIGYKAFEKCKEKNKKYWQNNLSNGFRTDTLEIAYNVISGLDAGRGIQKNFTKEELARQILKDIEWVEERLATLPSPEWIAGYGKMKLISSCTFFVPPRQQECNRQKVLENLRKRFEKE